MTGHSNHALSQGVAMGERLDLNLPHYPVQYLGLAGIKPWLALSRSPCHLNHDGLGVPG
ncbi:MAG: hypothetical protein AB1576_10580 [Bacillota bacterium]